MICMHLDLMFRRLPQDSEYEHEIQSDRHDTSEYDICDTPAWEEPTDRRSDEKSKTESSTDHSHIFRLRCLGRDIWDICLSDSESCSTESWDEPSNKEYDKKKADISRDNPWWEREPKSDISEQVERCRDREEILATILIRQSSEDESPEEHPDRVDSLRVWVPRLAHTEVRDDIWEYWDEDTDPEDIEEGGGKYEEHGRDKR